MQHSPRQGEAVTGRDGLRGIIRNLTSDQAEIELDSTHHRLLIPLKLLRRTNDGLYEIPLGASDIAPSLFSQKGSTGSTVVPITAEQLHVEKQPVETAQVVVHVEPHVKREVIRLPVQREEVAVQRVPIHRAIDAPTSVRQEGNVTIVPIFEEVLVVKKQLMLKEEIRITRHRLIEQHEQEVAVRQEEAHILRSDSPKMDS